MKKSRKIQRKVEARVADFNNNMKPQPKFKFHKPGSQNLAK